MVDCNLLRVCDLYKKTNIKDEDLKDDLDTVQTILEKNIKILTSFEKYVK